MKIKFKESLALYLSTSEANSPIVYKKGEVEASILNHMLILKSDKVKTYLNLNMVLKIDAV